MISVKRRAIDPRHPTLDPRPLECPWLPNTKKRRSGKRVTLKRLGGYLGLPIHRNQVPALDGIRSAEQFRAILDRSVRVSTAMGTSFRWSFLTWET